MSNFKDKPLVNLLSIHAVIEDRDVLNHHFSRAWAVADAAFILNPNTGVVVVTDAVVVFIAFTTASTDAQDVDVSAWLLRVVGIVASTRIRAVVDAVIDAI